MTHAWDQWLAMDGAFWMGIVDWELCILVAFGRYPATWNRIYHKTLFTFIQFHLFIVALCPWILEVGVLDGALNRCRSYE